MAFPFRVVLTDEQRAELRTMIGGGVAPARQFTRARILLKADHDEAGPGWSDAMIACALEVNPSTVQHVRRQFVQEGLAAPRDRKRPDRVYERLLDGKAEAHLIAVACGVPPAGQARESAPARRGGGALGDRAGDFVRNSPSPAQKTPSSPG